MKRSRTRFALAVALVAMLQAPRAIGDEAARVALAPLVENDVVFDARATFARELGGASDPRPGPFDTSEFLAGRVAVTVVLVDGPTRRFSRSDHDAAMADVREGLDFWTREMRAARLEFTTRVVSARVSVDPIALPSTARATWVRDAASQVLGAPAQDDVSGSYEIDRRAREQSGSDWAVTFYFVRAARTLGELARREFAFKDGWAAFTLFGGPYGVFPYTRIAGVHVWNPPVVAHELGHFFYALDEYARYTRQGHAATERSGYLDAPNANLEGGAGATRDEPCIMRSSVRSVLSFVADRFVDVARRPHRKWKYPICAATREAMACSCEADGDVTKPLAPRPRIEARARRRGARVELSGRASIVALANKNRYATGGHGGAPARDLSIDAVVAARARIGGGAWRAIEVARDASSAIDVALDGDGDSVELEIATRFGRVARATIAIER